MEPSEKFDDFDQPTFFQRHPLAIGAVLALVAGVIVWIAIAALSHQKSPSRSQQLQVVQLLPPPPPPPPPPTPPPQQATPPPEKMVEQQKMIEPEAKPKEELKKDEPPKPHEAPPGPLGLNAKGEGPGDAFGLVGRPGGNGLLGGGGGGGGSRWGWYANEVQNGITTALRKNPRTRTAKFSNLSIRIWLDKGGRVTRTQLSGSTGDPAVDNAIVNEALSGLQMQEPPPGDMPMPIVLRANARRLRFKNSFPLDESEQRKAGLRSYPSDADPCTDSACTMSGPRSVSNDYRVTFTPQCDREIVNRLITSFQSDGYRLLTGTG